MKDADSLIDYFNAWQVARMEIDLHQKRRPRTILRLQPLLTVHQYVKLIRSRDTKLANRLTVDVKRFSMRVRRLNKLVDLANNTLSRKQFKLYFTEAYRLMYGQYPKA